MGKILKAFLTDRLCLNDVTRQKTPEQKKLCEKSYELQEKLSAKLNHEENEMLTELVDTLSEEGCIDGENEFERGYRLGVLMTVEVFTERDIFL